MRPDRTVPSGFGMSDSTLRELSADFPAFTITWENLGRHGYCYVAERKGGTRVRPSTIITSDAEELRRELASGLAQT